MIQLDFFKTDEMVRLEEKIDKIKVSTEKVRRGNYASINEMNKLLTDLNERVLIMEKNICGG